MKCPKCGYLGFERVEQCRNCGYDFSLMAVAASPELPIREEAPAGGGLDDLPLAESRAPAPPATTELPLFAPPTPDDDQPLITRPSAPRTPLSVRRSTPEIPRLRGTPPRTPGLDFALDLDAPSTPGTPAARGGPARARPDVAEAEPGHERRDEDAPVAARFVAMVIDLLILAAVDVLVVYLTLQVCGVSLEELTILPKVPLIAFLVVQNGGYLVAFTAGGQTLGKMAAGIRVISSDAESLDVGRALLRTLMWFLLAIPAGLGFLTAVLSRDHRGLHDRFAGTRVVR